MGSPENSKQINRASPQIEGKLIATVPIIRRHSILLNPFVNQSIQNGILRISDRCRRIIGRSQCPAPFGTSPTGGLYNSIPRAPEISRRMCIFQARPPISVALRVKPYNAAVLPEPPVKFHGLHRRPKQPQSREFAVRLRSFHHSGYARATLKCKSQGTVSRRQYEVEMGAGHAPSPDDTARRVTAMENASRRRPHHVFAMADIRAPMRDDHNN
jgi:hypothetical protein